LNWRRIIKDDQFCPKNISALRDVFPSADSVGKYVVFNVGGNNYRLITSVHFNRGKVYIREFLTHSEYDKDRWKK